MEKFDLALIVYITLISAVSFVVTVVDKLNAAHKRRRVSEKALFILAAFGGSAVMYLTMCVIRHKTQKNKFVFGIPALFAIQCAAIWILHNFIP